MKSPKPNKLNLYEMWELYTLLGGGVSNKEYLIDEVSDMLGKIPRANFIQSIQLMYPNFTHSNPVETVLLFVSGLRKNYFFEFYSFIKGLNNGSSK